MALNLPQKEKRESDSKRPKRWTSTGWLYGDHPIGRAADKAYSTYKKVGKKVGKALGYGLYSSDYIRRQIEKNKQKKEWLKERNLKPMK